VECVYNITYIGRHASTSSAMYICIQ